MTTEAFVAAITPLAERLQGIDLSDPDAARAAVEAAAPFAGETVASIRELAVKGAAEGWLVPKEAGGVKFGRAAKDLHGFSVDVVSMDCPGPRHRHPNGEIDLCFTTSGSAQFDGHPEGWVVYGPDSVHVPTVTVGALMAIVSMRKTAEGQPRQAIMSALGTEFYVKTVVVVDEDVDVFDLSDVMWAVITRTRAEQDVIYIPGAMGAILDPTSDPEHHTVTKVGIDATKPTGRDFAERLNIANDQRDRVRGILERAGIRP